MERDDSFFLGDCNVDIQIRRFSPAEKAGEVHAILQPSPNGDGVEGQLERLYKAFGFLKEQYLDSRFKPVFLRFFMSDATNQAHLIRKEPDCAVSIIQQPPMGGSKVVMWVYLTDCPLEHNGYKHLWDMGMCVPEGDSAYQTEKLLVDYEKKLADEGVTLADNCIRTWFFVRDVDTNYAGLVKARRENFIEQGLTHETHYIASTGIGGSPAETKALVQMGCYAIKGIKPEQITYLYAPTHLNPTYEYGVTFERGTKVQYGDRAHLFISGTASINNKGEVVHVGDVKKQTERMCENVEALLSEGGATPTDVMQIIVYLRDFNDYSTAERIVESRFPNIPAVYTIAPVCRPTWLIEMECMAIVENKADFADF